MRAVFALESSVRVKPCRRPCLCRDHWSQAASRMPPGGTVLEATRGNGFVDIGVMRLACHTGHTGSRHTLLHYTPFSVTTTGAETEVSRAGVESCPAKALSLTGRRSDHP